MIEPLKDKAGLFDAAPGIVSQVTVAASAYPYRLKQSLPLDQCGSVFRQYVFDEMDPASRFEYAPYLA